MRILLRVNSEPLDLPIKITKLVNLVLACKMEFYHRKVNYSHSKLIATLFVYIQNITQRLYISNFISLDQ